MQRIVGFVLVAAIAVGLAWWWVERGPQRQVVQQAPRQQISYIIEGDLMEVVIATNRQPGEADEDLISRHVGLFDAWREATAESVTHGDPIHSVDDR